MQKHRSTLTATRTWGPIWHSGGTERKPRVWPSHTWAVLTLAGLSLFPRTLCWKNSLTHTKDAATGSGTRLTSGLQIYVMKNGGTENSFLH